MKKIFLVSLMAAASIFAGCNKEDGKNPGTGNERSNVLVQIGTGDNPGTRIEGDLIQANPALTLKDGYIVFTNANNVIERYVQMKSGGTPGTHEIVLPTIVSGAGSAYIEDVPNSATKCHIFSNIPSSVTIPAIQETVTHLNVFLNEIMGVNDLYDAVNLDGGVATVPMWGEGNVVQPSNDGDPLTTTVNVYAMGARLQVQKLTGIIDIEDYQLDGVFVNNYYEKMSVGYAPTVLKNNLSDGSKYKVPGGAYDGVYLSDYNTAGIADQSTPKVAVPKTEAAWVYNIWPTEGLASPGKETVPHIVFVFSNVTYSVGGTAQPPVAGPLYLTVKGMIEDDGSNTPVTKIEKGFSYTFQDIEFEFKNLTTVPESEYIDATVSISMIDWANKNVKPEL